MIAFCEGYGPDYDPSNQEITIAKLENKLTASQNGIDGVTTNIIPWKVAVNSRQDGFEGTRKLATRVVNSFAASGAPESAIDDAKGFKRKIDGARAETLVDDPNTPEDESQGNSVSQQSYVQLTEHWDNLIELLEAHSQYAPNETDLQTTSLTTYVDGLKALNTGVNTTIPPLSNARIARDEALYSETNGLVTLAALVKKYVKSVYGAGSPQYEQISGLEFTTPR